MRGVESPGIRRAGKTCGVKSKLILLLPSILLLLVISIWWAHDQPVYSDPSEVSAEGQSRAWVARQFEIVSTSLAGFALIVLAIVTGTRIHRLPWWHLLWEVPYFTFGLGTVNLVIAFALFRVVTWLNPGFYL